MVNFFGEGYLSSNNGASTSAGPSASSSLIDHFVGMGYPENMVTKAIQENGELNEELILDTLLVYSALNDSPSQSEPACVEHSSENENDTFDDILDFESCLAEKEDAVDMPDKEKKFLQLIEMDFQEEEASSAIDACDPDTLITDLIDFIYAARMAKRGDSPHPVPDYAETLPGYRGCPPTFKKREMLFDAEERQEKNLEIGSRRPKESKKIRKSVCIEEEDEDEVHIPKLMIGFGVPDEPRPLFQRKLSEAAIGPPYFYFENVACTPISHSLYEVEPEFVDSLHFCAAARKRGYVHNLPTCNRYPLEPIPSLTIHRALPLTRKWWPLWDHREKFNCFRTDVATAQRTHRIKDALELCNGDPPLNIQKDIISQCQKWNLVWTGKNKAAPLEPHEIEIIMGYPVNHTRGVTRTERYKSLGNSFQVDTVAYHFSVLKSMFPNGITVLSLFTGIGGAEIALHRLGIPLKTVVSVGVSEVSRSIFHSWWEQTCQTGNLIEIEDVQQLSVDKLQNYIISLGGFDLVVGGHHIDGLQGEQSVLFHEFYRIVDSVKCLMSSQR